MVDVVMLSCPLQGTESPIVQLVFPGDTYSTRMGLESSCWDWLANLTLEILRDVGE